MIQAPRLREPVDDRYDLSDFEWSLIGDCGLLHRPRTLGAERNSNTLQQNAFSLKNFHRASGFMSFPHPPAQQATRRMPCRNAA